MGVRIGQGVGVEPRVHGGLRRPPGLVRVGPATVVLRTLGVRLEDRERSSAASDNNAMTDIYILSLIVFGFN